MKLFPYKSDTRIGCNSKNGYLLLTVLSISFIGLFLLTNVCKADSRPTLNNHTPISPIHHIKTINLNSLLERPIHENVLKLFGYGVAIDELDNRVYVSGIMTPGIAVLDGEDEIWIDLIETGMSFHYSLKYLYIDHVSKYLYLIDKTNDTLRRIDLHSREILGPIKIPEGHGMAAVDTKRHYIYITAKDRPFLSVYDGQDLSLVFRSDEMGPGIGRPVYDAIEDKMYLMDSLITRPQRKIFVLDPETFSLEKTITYTIFDQKRTISLLWDPHNRLFIISNNLNKAYVLNEEGSLLNTITFPLGLTFDSMEYIADKNQLLILFHSKENQNEVKPSFGHLYVYNPLNSRILTELPIGRMTHGPQYNRANEKIYLPSGDASCLFSVDSKTYDSPESLRLGESVEYIVGGSESGSIVFNSRLGGSYLVAYNIHTDIYDIFTSGFWPIPIRSSNHGEQLFVLNAWDSVLAIYSLIPKLQLLKEIELGIPRGSSDRLPDMIIDDLHSIAYIAYPELAILIAVNLLEDNIEYIHLDGFPGGEGDGGPGNLQLAVDPLGERFYVLFKRERRLQIYSTSTDTAPTLSNTINLSSLDWSITRDGPTIDLLFIDRERNTLFVGPFEIDLRDNMPTGRALGSGLQIIDLDTVNNTYWVNGITREAPHLKKSTVAMLDRHTLQPFFEYTLDPVYTAKPFYYLDIENELLYAGHLHTAELKVYQIDRMR